MSEGNRYFKERTSHNELKILNTIMYNNTGRDLLLFVMIYTFLCVMINTAAERKIYGKHIILKQLA